MKKIAFLFLFLAASCTVLSGNIPLTFVVWSDSHFGAYDYADTTRLKIIDQINAIGQITPPEGFIAEKDFIPDFLIHCGDITERGTDVQWNDPNSGDQQSYLRTISHLRPEIKPYAALGNHDSRKSSNIRDLFAAMYKGTYYSFDCKDVHFVILDPYSKINPAAPSLDDTQLAWLEDDFKKLMPYTPVVIVMHILPYFDKAFDRTSRLDQQSSEALAKIISGRNILAFLHGHWHTQSVKEWNGIPVIAPAGFAYYRKGCKNCHPVLGVIQITDTAFTIYTYNWENRSYNNTPLYQKNFSIK